MEENEGKHRLGGGLNDLVVGPEAGLNPTLFGSASARRLMDVKGHKLPLLLVSAGSVLGRVPVRSREGWRREGWTRKKSFRGWRCWFRRSGIGGGRLRDCFLPSYSCGTYPRVSHLDGSARRDLTCEKLASVVVKPLSEEECVWWPEVRDVGGKLRSSSKVVVCVELVIASSKENWGEERRVHQPGFLGAGIGRLRSRVLEIDPSGFVRRSFCCISST